MNMNVVSSRKLLGDSKLLLTLIETLMSEIFVKNLHKTDLQNGMVGEESRSSS